MCQSPERFPASGTLREDFEVLPASGPEALGPRLPIFSAGRSELVGCSRGRNMTSSSQGHLRAEPRPAPPRRGLRARSSRDFFFFLFSAPPGASSMIGLGASHEASLARTVSTAAEDCSRIILRSNRFRYLSRFGIKKNRSESAIRNYCSFPRSFFCCRGRFFLPSSGPSRTTRDS